MSHAALIPCPIREDGSYDYRTVPNGESQYKGIDFTKQTIVNAQYIHSDDAPGNPSVEALPPPRTEKAIVKAANQAPTNYSYENEMLKSKVDQIHDVLLLRSIRFILPMYIDIARSCSHTLLTTYAKRTLQSDQAIDIPYNMRNQQCISHSKSVGSITDGAFPGFCLTGKSGSGKSSALKIIQTYYPQMIIHHFADGSTRPQIVYLIVDCPIRSNFSALLQNIGHEIDKALGNLIPVYENELTPAHGKNIGQMINKLRNLIEKLDIGLIVLDEVQNLNFDAQLENSIGSLLLLTNSTKVSFALVGTEYSHRLFNDIRDLYALRRAGSEIVADNYCDSEQYFAALVKKLFLYQWFNPRVEPDSELIDALKKYSIGIIDQLINIYSFMQIDYLQASNKPIINADYVARTAKKHFPNMHKILMAANPQAEAEKQKIIEAANREIEQITNASDQSRNSLETILNNPDFISPPPAADSLLDEIVQSVYTVVGSCYNTDSISASTQKIINLQKKKQGITDKHTLCQLVFEDLSKKKSDKRKSVSTVSPKEKKIQIASILHNASVSQDNPVI